MITLRPMGIQEIDQPSAETLAVVATLDRYSDFSQVSFVVGAVFWRSVFATTVEAQKWPEFVKWAVGARTFFFAEEK